MLKIIYFIVLGICLVGFLLYYISFKKYCKENDIDVSVLEEKEKK